jgi:type IV pilus assembly protein PilC
MKENDFFYQLSLLLKAETPLPEALQSIVELSSDKKLYAQIQEQVDSGVNFSEAVAASGKFSTSLISLLETAEKNDSLESTLMDISRYTQMESLIRSKAKSIVFYPFTVLLFFFISFGVFSSHYLLGFKKVFTDLADGEELPLLTNLLLNVGHVIHSNIILYYSILVLLAVAFFLLYFDFVKSVKLESLTMKAGCLWSRLPYYFNFSKFCSFLAMNISKEVQLHEILKSAVPVITTPKLQREFRIAAQQIIDGNDHNQVIDSMKYTDPLIRHCLKISNPQILTDELHALADLFYERSFLVAERLLVYWEIALIIFVACVTGFMAMAVFMPLNSLMNSM